MRSSCWKDSASADSFFICRHMAAVASAASASAAVACACRNQAVFILCEALDSRSPLAPHQHTIFGEQRRYLHRAAPKPRPASVCQAPSKCSSLRI